MGIPRGGDGEVECARVTSTSGLAIETFRTDGTQTAVGEEWDKETPWVK
jgi:hypothetical protein